MGSDQVVQRTRATADARLGFGVAVSCVVAYAGFVVLPYYANDPWAPLGAEGVWALGGMVTLVLGPVAAGLSGYASLAALWSTGDTLPTTSRRLHLGTLLVVATVFLGLFSAWGADVVSWWLD